MGRIVKVRLAAAIGASAVVALGFSSSSFAQTAMIPELGDEQVASPAKPTPKRCEGGLVSLGATGADRYGLPIYKWSVCGRRGGIPFG